MRSWSDFFACQVHHLLPWSVEARNLRETDGLSGSSLIRNGNVAIGIPLDSPGEHATALLWYSEGNRPQTSPASRSFVMDIATAISRPPLDAGVAPRTDSGRTATRCRRNINLCQERLRSGLLTRQKETCDEATGVSDVTHESKPDPGKE